MDEIDEQLSRPKRQLVNDNPTEPNQEHEPIATKRIRIDKITDTKHNSSEQPLIEKEKSIILTPSSFETAEDSQNTNIESLTSYPETEGEPSVLQSENDLVNNLQINYDTKNKLDSNHEEPESERLYSHVSLFPHPREIQNSSNEVFDKTHTQTEGGDSIPPSKFSSTHVMKRDTTEQDSRISEQSKVILSSGSDSFTNAEEGKVVKDLPKTTPISQRKRARKIKTPRKILSKHKENQNRKKKSTVQTRKNRTKNKSTGAKQNYTKPPQIRKEKTNITNQSLETMKVSQNTNMESLISNQETVEETSVLQSEISLVNLQINNDTKNKLYIDNEESESERLSSTTREIQNSNEVIDNTQSQIEGRSSNSSVKCRTTHVMKRDTSELDSPIPKQDVRFGNSAPSDSFSTGNAEDGTAVKDFLKTTPLSQKKKAYQKQTPRKTVPKPKGNQIRKKRSTSQDNRGIKRNTAHGDEYQRIIQILVRHRGYEIPGFELRTEVRHVGSLDDLVCVSSNKCRFIQVKHSQRTETKNELRNLFKTDCCLSNKPVFELVLYFISFCEIKKNEIFKSYDIEEITLLTNLTLVPEHETNRDNKTEIEKKFEDFLVLRNDFKSDCYLYLERGNGIKYSLNINALKECNEFMDVLQRIYYDQFQTKPEMANEMITEYMEKVCVVVGYPNVNELPDLVFPEIFNDLELHSKDLHLLQNSLIHSEIKKLMIRGEENNENYKCLSNENWTLTIDEVKSFINKCKLTGIANYETHKLLNQHGSIKFEIERIKDMYDDIVTLLTHDKEVILHCNNVQNEKLVSIKTLNVICHVKEEGFLKGNVVSYTDLHSLLDDKYFGEQFIAGSINTLIITVGKDHFDVDREPLFEELANKLVKGMQNQNQKIILISTSHNLFTEQIKHLSGEKYSEKIYNHDFSCLNLTSRKEILAKTVLFQGERIPFGSLFKDDQKFANSVVDENVLLEITDVDKKHTLSDRAAVVSPGYSTDYYTSRELFHKYINFDVIKERIREELFFMTPSKGVEHYKLKKFLKKNDIDEKYIHEWPKKPKNGKRKVENNGIILRGFANESNEQIFKEITERNVVVHWLLVWDNNLVHVDSKCNLRDRKALPTIESTYKEEVTLLNSEPLEKILILAGDSGVGKSTILTHLANNIKLSNDEPVWVVKVNLRMFYRKKILRQIGDLTKIDATVSLISEMGSLSDSSKIISKKIIEEGLKKSQKDNFNIVLLLDGFNEINSSFQDRTCSLIKTLHSNCNVKQIYVTTQIQGKVKLENRLEVPAYYLDNLNDEKQVSLMVKYWTTKYKSNDTSAEYDINALQQDAQRALETWKKSINDKDDQSFTHVSLNVIILSEILLNDRQINESIDLCRLYELFVHKKFSIYNEEISEPKRQLTDVEQVKEKMFEYSIKEILQELSVKMILTTFQKNETKDKKNATKGKKNYATEKLLKSMTALDRFKHFVTDLQKNDIEVNYQTILSKIGLLSVKEEIDFTHESFAQYFFSEYLVNNLKNITMKTFFVKYVLSENHLYLCRRFTNNLIKKHFEALKAKKEMKYNIFKTISPLTKTNISNDVKMWAVTKVTEEKLDHIIIFLLHIMGAQRHNFLEQWVRNEVNCCNEEEESVRKVLNFLDNVEQASVPFNLRIVLKIDKSDDERETKLTNILQDQWLAEFKTP